jgi:hypothetical protein
LEVFLLVLVEFAQVLLSCHETRMISVVRHLVPSLVGSAHVFYQEIDAVSFYVGASSSSPSGSDEKRHIDIKIHKPWNFTDGPLVGTDAPFMQRRRGER